MAKLESILNLHLRQADGGKEALCEGSHWYLAANRLSQRRRQSQTSGLAARWMWRKAGKAVSEADSSMPRWRSRLADRSSATSAGSMSTMRSSTVSMRQLLA